jgi:hypothetical protein
MSPDFIPSDVAQFIIDRIDSVAEMEALLLLRSNTEEEWSVDALAKRLYISVQQTAYVLDRLSSGGFLSVRGAPPVFRYQPGSPELQSLVDRACTVYSKHLVPITNLIHSKPKSRVQEFADAFKLRKDE